jgi:hypothetical protein
LLAPEAVVGAEPEVVQHGHAGKNLAALGHVSHTQMNHPLRSHARQIPVPEPDSPAPGRHDTHDGVEEGGLSRAVRPVQRDDLSPEHLDRDAVEDLDPAIPGHQPLDRQHRSVFSRVHMRSSLVPLG